MTAAVGRRHSALSGVSRRPFGERGGSLATPLHCLICRVGERTCALPIEHAREVMRPVAIERVPSAPAYLLGLSVIRGENVPVLDAGSLLTGEPAEVKRLVVLRVGERRVALAVAAVVGTRALQPAELDGLPPLLAGARELVRALAVLDGGLLEVLESARLVELGQPTLAEASAR
jgi:purine-binding chemotaxis protein CheW